jgi:hypothetical protein
MGNSMIKKLAAVVIAVLLLVYVGCQIYNATYSQVQTESASHMTVSATIDATGYFVRKEIPITSEIQGVLTYLLEDGEKVRKDGVIAEVYPSADDVAAQKEISSLKAEIERLKILDINSTDAFATSPEGLDKQITEGFRGLLSDVNSGNFDQIDEKRENLLYLMNQRQVITGRVENFSSRINELQARLEQLQSEHGESIGKILAPEPGYFVSELDGYENSLSYENILQVTAEQLQAYPDEPAVVSQSSVGKLVGGLNWYVACTVSAENALRLKECKNSGAPLYLDLPFAMNENVPIEIVAINQADTKAEAAVVMRCSYMNEELSHLRKEPIQIVTNTYSGLRVSRKAIHMGEVAVLDEEGNETGEKKEVTGVYVLFGSELVFKPINILYSTSTYVICQYDQESDDRKTLKLYDEVVVGGTNLYDGKLVK